MTTDISGIEQIGYSLENILPEPFERRIRLFGRFANERARDAVRRPLLRVQAEVAMFEGDDGGPAHGTCDMSRTRIDRHNGARALERGDPLVKRQAAH